jgi:hypothetical protein
MAVKDATYASPIEFKYIPSIIAPMGSAHISLLYMMGFRGPIPEVQVNLSANDMKVRRLIYFCRRNLRAL